MNRPLEGVRVVAVEQYGAGPYGTQLLSELGAEVIKIEAVSMGGDVSRATGPFFLGENDSHFFQTFSRGKKSVTIELKTPEGRAAFERLVGAADAVVNNLRGDQPAKLKITHDDLKAIKPSIVCGHLSAYGRDNSRKTWPGYDYLMQAEAGFMSLTGEPDGPPIRFGLSMVDFMTGSVFALGVVSAILGARRTGVGCDVDVSLFDVALHQTSYPATWAMNEGYEIERMPRAAHPSIAPSQLVRTADGWAMLMCQTPKFWDAFCTVVERPDLKADQRFIDIPTRRQNIEALTEALDAVMQTKPTDDWLTLLGGQVPFAPVRGLKEALDNPYVAEVGMRDVVDHPERPEGLHLLACPIKIDGRRASGVRAPLMGEHNAELLDEGAA
ncbi:CaiB/BaiF CoA transferase family protein [Brevundimonas naejangsanensis]|uniref:CaiB/BaiF CoA transferase family protein n=1 Tax=Brevundimonas naejangsanensis TaxID=588932 RepID=UPI0003F6D226|nr:CoA transferase [Brevundimonas naejangsanensis]